MKPLAFLRRNGSGGRLVVDYSRWARTGHDRNRRRMAEMIKELRFTALVAALAAGCDMRSGPDPFAFKNDVQTNAQVDSDTLDLTFTDRDGNPVELKSYR